jgi:predicted RNA-binding Zn-ribbon protein involved in translation (DUF1610 family)
MSDNGSDTPAGGGAQVSLEYDSSTLEVAEPDRDGRHVVCPDCGRRVGASKSGGKELPDTEARAFGWSCNNCNLTLPSNCLTSKARSFNDQMTGLETEFRDGSSQYVPVSKHSAPEVGDVE